jgi:hypothetical protein
LRLANTRRCPIGLNAEEPLRRELPVVAQVNTADETGAFEVASNGSALKAAGDGSGSQRASVSPQP